MFLLSFSTHAISSKSWYAALYFKLEIKKIKMALQKGRCSEHNISLFVLDISVKTILTRLTPFETIQCNISKRCCNQYQN